MKQVETHLFFHHYRFYWNHSNHNWLCLLIKSYYSWKYGWLISHGPNLAILKKIKLYWNPAMSVFFLNVFFVVAFILKGRVEELWERPYSLQSWNNSLAFYKKSLLTIALKKPLSNYYYYITGNYYILLRFKLWLSATCNNCSASFLQLSQNV